MLYVEVRSWPGEPEEAGEEAGGEVVEPDLMIHFAPDGWPFAYEVEHALVRSDLVGRGPGRAPFRPTLCRLKFRAEWGMLPIPRKLVRQGVRDMVRISDARMSGTSYGACILHVAPEAWIGGPLALVRTGDVIEIDVDARRLHLDIPEDEFQARKAAWTAPPPRYERGYGWMFSQHIRQANDGADFDFLEAGPPTPEPEIH